MSDETTTDMLAEIEGQLEHPQPVQVCEGRWRTRGGEIRNVTPTPDDDDRATEYPWYDAEYDQTWQNNGRWDSAEEHQRDLVQYLGPIEQPDPGTIITPDDVGSEALAGVWDQAKAEQQIAELRSEVHHVQKLYGEAQNQVVEQQHRIQDLLTLNDTQQAEAAAVNEKRLQQVVDLRNDLNHVQRLLGESRQRVTQLEELVGSLRTINEAQEKAVSAAGQRNTDLLKLLDNKKRRISELETLVVDLRVSNEATEKAVEAAGRENTDLQHRLDVVSAEWAEQAGTLNGLQQQLEAVKAELVAQAETSRRLQIELDAREQVPQAVSDRFEEGWDAGTARAVETIVEWTEPFRACGSERLAWQVMANLPHIMRSLTGLTPED